MEYPPASSVPPRAFILPAHAAISGGDALNQVSRSMWTRLRQWRASAWTRVVAMWRRPSQGEAVEAPSDFGGGERHVEQELLETGPGPLIDIAPESEVPTPWPLGEAAGGFVGGSFTAA